MPEEKNQKQPRKKIGLALGGGGAKGLAHIGVIKALEKAGIPIDFIAGTSMGALVGAWYAVTKNIVFLENIFLKITKSDLFPPQKLEEEQKGIFFKNENIAKFLKLEFDGKEFKQSSIPFAAVATDVNTGQEVIFKEGQIKDAVEASIAFPIIFKPIEVNGQMLMDGGLSNPVPADVVREMGADFVLAVDVSSRWINFSDGSVTQSNMHEILNKAFVALEYQIAQKTLKQADIVLRPSVLPYSWLDFSEAQEIIKAGFREAERNLGEIRKKSGYRKREPKTVLEAISNFLNEERL